jgi:phage gp45-like
MSQNDFKKVVETRLGAKARVLVVDLRGAGQEGADEDAEFTSDNESFQPLGFVARPVMSSTLEALVIRMGDQDLVVHFADKGQAKYTDLEEGETRLYGAKEASSVIRIRAGGSIEITSKPSTDIVLNGGTLKVARATDTVSVTIPINALSLPVVGGGGGTATGPSAPLTVTGTIDSGTGATHVKA